MRALKVVALLAGVSLALAAPAAGAQRRLVTIMQDDATFLYGTDDQVAAALARAKDLGVDRIRLTANWAVLAPEADEAVQPTFDAADPSAYTHNGFAHFDPVNYWMALDRAVRLADKDGLGVMIDLGFWAPRWASDDPRPSRRTMGIDPEKFAEFVKAVVTRYSGRYVPGYGTPQPPPRQGPEAPPSSNQTALGLPGLPLFSSPQSSTPSPSSPPPDSVPPPAPLPRVSVWTVWNEPNHPGFLQPQWQQDAAGFSPNSPYLYRELVDAAYPVIKTVEPDSTVLVGATSSIGVENPSSVSDGMPPLTFIRALACVDRSLRPLTTGSCASYTPLEGDGWSHHPYELMHTPDWSDRRKPDNAEIGDLSRLTTLLDRLVAMRRIAPGLRRLWLTEFGYESNPPDPAKPFNPLQQAQLINWSEYLASRNPDVQSFPQFLLNDMGTVSATDASRGRRAWGDWQSGLYFRDGTPKPAATSFAMAMHVHCVSDRRRRWFSVWGRIRPGSGVRIVTLQQLRWRPSTVSFPTDANGYFLRTRPYARGSRFVFSYSDAAGIHTGIPEVPDRCHGMTPQPRVAPAGSNEH
jgi:hypothetical protein